MQRPPLKALFFSSYCRRWRSALVALRDLACASGAGSLVLIVTLVIFLAAIISLVFADQIYG
jgi:hypothetical protein